VTFIQLLICLESVANLIRSSYFLATDFFTYLSDALNRKLFKKSPYCSFY